MAVQRIPGFHGSQNGKIGVGVEAIDKATSLVVEIAADIEPAGNQSATLVVETARIFAVAIGVAAEPLVEERRRLVTQHGDLPRQGQTTLGLMLGKIMPVCPLRILLDRGALQVIQGDTHGRERSYSDDGSALDTLRLEDCPFQRLHTADRSAEDKAELFDSERINEPGLGAHVVANGNQREVGTVGASRFGIERTRPG